MSSKIVISATIHPDGTVTVNHSPNDRRNITLTDDECAFFDALQKGLEAAGVDLSHIHLERRSDNYLSVVAYDHYDFVRFHVGLRSSWFSVWVAGEHRKDLLEDLRFSAQKNKRQLHWKVQVHDISDIAQCYDLLQLAYQSMLESKSHSISSNQTK